MFTVDREESNFILIQCCRDRLCVDQRRLGQRLDASRFSSASKGRGGYGESVSRSCEPREEVEAGMGEAMAGTRFGLHSVAVLVGFVGLDLELVQEGNDGVVLTPD
jgi:hypothetical protein